MLFIICMNACLSGGRGWLKSRNRCSASFSWYPTRTMKRGLLKILGRMEYFHIVPKIFSPAVPGVE